MQHLSINQIPLPTKRTCYMTLQQAPINLYSHGSVQLLYFPRTFHNISSVAETINKIEDWKISLHQHKITVQFSLGSIKWHTSSTKLEHFLGFTLVWKHEETKSDMNLHKLSLFIEQSYKNNFYAATTKSEVHKYVCLTSYWGCLRISCFMRRCSIWCWV